jgi:hypothetical protein
MGVQTSAPFANTYSLAFDGIDDRVQLSSDFVASGEFTLSFWMKPTAAGSPNGKIYPIGTFPGNSNYVKIDQIGVMWLRLGGVNAIFNEAVYGGGANNLVLNDWQNIVFIRDSSSVIRCYRNGVDFGYNVAAAANSNTLTLNSFGRIITNTFGFEGGLDEIALFNTDETSNLSTLSTSPTVDLTDLNPKVWLRNGDNGAYKSPQWLIPSNENKDKVSNYSFSFDGIDDKVSIGTALDLGINSTLSFWIKRGRVSTSEVWFGEDSYSSDYLVTITSSTILYFRINTSYVGWNYPTVKSILNNTTEWVNVCIVRSANSVELFLNGISYGTGNSNAGTPGSTVTRFDTIGASPYALHTFAQFDEIAAWNNNTVNPLDIYNGGQPTTISGAIAHYKMGEDATFSGGVWTVPDSVGSNNGTSNGMTIEDRLGEAPNSENNALSYNMDLIDRTTDVPT